MLERSFEERRKERHVPRLPPPCKHPLDLCSSKIVHFKPKIADFWQKVPYLGVPYFGLRLYLFLHRFRHFNLPKNRHFSS